MFYKKVSIFFLFQKFYLRLPGISTPADSDNIKSLENSDRFGSINNLEKISIK